jgi:transposase InsO family protein
MPNNIVALDIVALPTSPNNEKYALVVMCLFSKFVTAIPLTTKDSTVVAQAFEERWAQEYGWPTRVLSDEGMEFKGAFSTMMRDHNVRRLFTTAYHPQTDGQVERFNQTLLSTLSIVSGTGRSKWPTHIDEVCRAYNAAVNTVTGYPPVFLFLGEWPRDQSTSMVTKGEPTHALSAARAAVVAMYRKDEERLATYNRDAIAFDVGANVWVRNPNRARTVEEKLDPA